MFINPSLNFNNDLHIDTTLLLMVILKTLSIPHFLNFGEFSVAKYLNVSPAMIRSLEQGQRHAHGAILKLLNIVEKHGISGLT